ncbi:MAG: NAD(P)-dependent oxidoreductase, partial [Polaromonas sp.]|nr:NAD(P)-dependent oxidoreductase [Polaromonas sp.]
FMGPAAARNAQGSMMVAGPQVLFGHAKADLARLASRLECLEERPDLGAVNKLFGNAMIIGMSSILADILTIAKASGVKGDDAIELLGLLDLNAMVAGRGKKMAQGNFAVSFELAMARKDVRLMLETAGYLPMSVLPGIAQRMDQLIAQGHGAEDASVVGIDSLS